MANNLITDCTGAELRAGDWYEHTRSWFGKGVIERLEVLGSS